MSKEEKEMERKSGNEPVQFFVGLILLAVGLFMFSKRIVVHSSWYTWRFWGIGLSSGTVVIPLIIGIIWYFYNPKSKASKIIMILGGIFIIATVIMSVRIDFIATSMFDYLLILGMTAAGTGLLLKTFFWKK